MTQPQEVYAALIAVNLMVNIPFAIAILRKPPMPDFTALTSNISVATSLATQVAADSDAPAIQSSIDAANSGVVGIISTLSGLVSTPSTVSEG